jgi:malonyl CoA-acyl carrier protein transacylase
MQMDTCTERNGPAVRFIDAPARNEYLFSQPTMLAGEKMQTHHGNLSWDRRRTEKKRRLTQAAAFADGRVVPSTDIVPFLEALIAPGDRVVLEGNNQKQADDLARNMAVPVKWHDTAVLAYEQGVRLSVEMPPGSVLTKRSKAALPEALSVSARTRASTRCPC